MQTAGQKKMELLPKENGDLNIQGLLENVSSNGRL